MTQIPWVMMAVGLFMMLGSMIAYEYSQAKRAWLTWFWTIFSATGLLVWFSGVMLL